MRALVKTVAEETFGELFAPSPVPLNLEEDDWSLAWVAVSSAKIVGVVLTNQDLSQTGRGKAVDKPCVDS